MAGVTWETPHDVAVNPLLGPVVTPLFTVFMRSGNPMSKPETLHDLHLDGQFSLRDADAIARTIFDGENELVESESPEGYVVTACAYDDLPEHIQGFIRKAILAFTVENVLDAADADDFDNEMDALDNIEKDLDQA